MSLPFAYIVSRCHAWSVRIVATPVVVGGALAVYSHIGARLGLAPYQLVVLATIVALGVDFEAPLLVFTRTAARRG